MVYAVPLAILIVVALYLATRGGDRRRGKELAGPRRRDRSDDGMTHVDPGHTDHTASSSHDGSGGGGGASGDWGGGDGGDGGGD